MKKSMSDVPVADSTQGLESPASVTSIAAWPWRLGAAYDYNMVHIVPILSADGRDIGEANANYFKPVGPSYAVRADRSEIKANARLMAAAPRMLAILKLIDYGNFSRSLELITEVRAAIAQAEGRVE